MKKLALVALLLACQKQEDASTQTSTTASATATASASASAAPSVATVATIQATPTASASTAPGKVTEQQQMQMLQAIDNKKAIEEVLRSSDLPANDLSASPRDGGRTTNRDH